MVSGHIQPYAVKHHTALVFKDNVCIWIERMNIIASCKRQTARANAGGCSHHALPLHSDHLQNPTALRQFNCTLPAVWMYALFLSHSRPGHWRRHADQAVEREKATSADQTAL